MLGYWETSRRPIVNGTTNLETVPKTPAFLWSSISHFTNCASTAWPWRRHLPGGAESVTEQ